jgi:hypothetical protein
MANNKDGIKPSVILIGAVVLLGVFAAAMYGSSLMDAGPPKPEKFTMSAIEPAPAPPEGPEINERVRTFFMKGNVEECMHRHLGKESRVDGLLEIELLPDGTVTNAEAKTEPQNGGVALCIQQRFARGFTFAGPNQKVSYTFNGRWDSGRLMLGQNVTSNRK